MENKLLKILEAYCIICILSSTSVILLVFIISNQFQKNLLALQKLTIGKQGRKNVKKFTLSMFNILEKLKNFIRKLKENIILTQLLKSKKPYPKNLLINHNKEFVIFKNNGQRINLMNFICYAQQKINFKKDLKFFSVMVAFQINYC